MVDDPNRQMHDAARRLAYLHQRKLAEAAEPPLDFGTVASYTAGPPRVVTVTIRDASNPITANWLANSYTPVVGDRVLCVWVGNQLAVLGAGG